MEPQIIHQELPDGSLTVHEIFNDGNLSGAIVILNGTNRCIRHEEAEATYLVLEGEGLFNVNGTEVYVEKGQLITIPKGTFYFDKGNMTMLAVNEPGFDASKVEVLEG